MSSKRLIQAASICYALALALVILLLFSNGCGRYIEIDCYTSHGIGVSNQMVPSVTCDDLEAHIDCLMPVLLKYDGINPYCVVLALSYGIIELHDSKIVCPDGKKECGGLYYGRIMEVYMFRPIEKTALHHELVHHITNVCIDLDDQYHTHPVWNELHSYIIC